jgi:hypothetical protein
MFFYTLVVHFVSLLRGRTSCTRATQYTEVSDKDRDEKAGLMDNQMPPPEYDQVADKV